jgi:hypothetical protein
MTVDDKKSLNRALWFFVLIATLVCVTPSPCIPDRNSNLNGKVQSAGNPNVRVWVNTNSGVYHCPGTRWYGKTKRGEFMTQKQAQSKGYRPAYGIACG